MGPPALSQSFVVTAALRAAGTAKFIDELSMEIQKNASSIGLDSYCKDGGTVGEVYVENLSLDEVDQRGVISGSFSVSFEESYYAGCRDIDWKNRFRGTMDFELEFGEDTLSIVDETIVGSPDPQDSEDE